MLDQAAVSECLDRQNLSGGVLCLHSSYKSFGPCKNGPATVIEGFRANNTTLLCPSFYYRGGTYPPEGENEKWTNNGIDYTTIDRSNPQSYENLPEQIDPSMGIIPKTLLQIPGVYRSCSPENSFAAIGPLAQQLCAVQTNIDVYAPYKEIHRSGVKAFIVLAGVDLTSCTPVHYAEELAGKGLFRRWVLHHGTPVEICVGSCSEGFEKLAPHTRDLERRFKIGDSTVHVYEFSAFVERVAQVLKQDPGCTACDNPDCLRCREMAAGGCRARLL